jgi:hypothetical protein
VRFLPPITFALLAVSPAFAQDRPDFSGEWVRVEPPADSVVTLSVVERDQSLVLNNHPSWGPRSVAVPLQTGGGLRGLLLGNDDIVRGVYTSRNIISASRGPALIVWEVRRVKNLAGGTWAFAGTWEEVWSLDSEGRLIIAVTDQEVGARNVPVLDRAADHAARS